MDIYSLGHSSFKIKGKNVTVLTDPFDPKMVGLKWTKIDAANLVLISHDHADHNYRNEIPDGAFFVSGPGEYEISGVTVNGIATFHDDKNGEERGKNTIYKFVVDGVNFVHLGDLGHKLTDAQVEEIGNADVLFVPVGGTFTIDAKVASEVVAQIEPSVVIPMHYGRSGLNPQIGEKLAGVEVFLKEMGVEGTEKVNKYSTSKDRLPENTTVVVLE